MSRFTIANGKKIVPQTVGVNSQTGKYHKQGCRYYGSTEKEMRVGLLRAQEEKWRLAVWVFGIGAVVIGVLALLVKSPLDYRGRTGRDEPGERDC